MCSPWTFHASSMEGGVLDSERNCPPCSLFPCLPHSPTAETAPNQMGKDLLTPKANGGGSIAPWESLGSSSMSSETRYLSPMDAAPMSPIRLHASLVNLFPVGHSLQANLSTGKVSTSMTKLIITKSPFPAKPPLLRESESKLPTASL